MDGSAMNRTKQIEGKDMEKLCIFCTNLEWQQERAMGTEWTGEYGTSGFSCNRGHFDAYGKGEDRSFHDINDVRGLFLTATDCQDYVTPNSDIEGKDNG